MYTAGKMKKHVRNDVFLYLSDCHHILTLPNLYFSLEQRLAKKMKVDCVEIKKQIYLKQIQIVPCGIILNHGDVQYLDISKYDGMFLDMCGPFTFALSNTLKSVKSDCKLVITLMMAREGSHVKNIINIKEREKSYISLFNSYGIRISKFINYRDTTPMCTFFGTKIL